MFWEDVLHPYSEGRHYPRSSCKCVSRGYRVWEAGIRTQVQIKAPGFCPWWLSWIRQAFNSSLAGIPRSQAVFRLSCSLFPPDSLENTSVFSQRSVGPQGSTSFRPLSNIWQVCQQWNVGRFFSESPICLFCAHSTYRLSSPPNILRSFAFFPQHSGPKTQLQEELLDSHSMRNWGLLMA